MSSLDASADRRNDTEKLIVEFSEAAGYEIVRRVLDSRTELDELHAATLNSITDHYNKVALAVAEGDTSLYKDLLNQEPPGFSENISAIEALGDL